MEEWENLNQGHLDARGPERNDTITLTFGAWSDLCSLVQGLKANQEVMAQALHHLQQGGNVTTSPEKE